MIILMIIIMIITIVIMKIMIMIIQLLLVIVIIIIIIMIDKIEPPPSPPSRGGERGAFFGLGARPGYSCSRRCALIGVPCCLGTLSIFSAFDNILKLTIAPQAKSAETNPRQGTPMRAHLQLPEIRPLREPAPRIRVARSASVGADYYAPDLTRVKIHWKVPVNVHWRFPEAGSNSACGDQLCKKGRRVVRAT